MLRSINLKSILLYTNICEKTLNDILNMIKKIKIYIN